MMSVYRWRYYAFLFFIQLWLVAIQLFNIDPILIDRLHLSQQKNRWQPLNARLNAQAQQKWRRVRTELGKEKRINYPIWPFNKKMDKLSTSLNTVEWSGGYFNVAGHIHKTSDRLQPQLSRQSVVPFTAQDSGTSERREMAWLFLFYRQGATTGMKISSCEPRKRFRLSALSSGVKKSWKLKKIVTGLHDSFCARMCILSLQSLDRTSKAFERFSSFVRDRGRLFVYFSQQRLICSSRYFLD